ncbi:MAG: glutathione S-transferase family protein [Betaproteobacteria bacterium]|nr:glutathione S-transferase family protein [Betaproteobacteria bacterium]
MLKIWGRMTSINVQKVAWCVDELGIPYERIDAGREFGHNDTPEYLAKNPNGLIPLIEDDGFALWESNAIVRYLAAKHGLGTLCPSDAQERASADRWMDWQATTLNISIGACFVQLIRTLEAARDLKIVETNRPIAEKRLAMLDGVLAKSAYLNGDRFTMADIPAGLSVRRWQALPLEKTAHANVSRWLAALAKRPGARQAFAVPVV